MDCVYICGPGYNEELRYSIRSVVANLPHANIWVVGDRPGWYTGNFIPVKLTGVKYNNARNNLSAIVNSTEISDQFYLMNDDFFVLNKIDNFVDWNSGSLYKKVVLYEELVSNSWYTKMLSNTYKRLVRLGFKDPIDYELHVPMKMEKDKLAKVLKYTTELWRSMYGNMFEVGGDEHEDVKYYINGKLLSKSFNYIGKHTDYLSTADDSFEIVHKDVLSKMFPNKSKYER
jgi:hypothetical protein